jgi:hypothetical protein
MTAILTLTELFTVALLSCLLTLTEFLTVALLSCLLLQDDDIDPLDPSYYSDAPRGKWSAGMAYGGKAGLSLSLCVCVYLCVCVSE